MNARDIAILLGVGTAAILILGYAGKKTIAATVDTVGGVLSGHNALTTNTPYDGYGVVGTLGAATNSLLGGMPQNIGEWLSGKIFDVTH